MPEPDYRGPAYICGRPISQGADLHDWLYSSLLNDKNDHSGVLRRNPRFFRPPKLSPVEQLYTVSAQLTIRGYVAVQRLSGYPQLLA